ncbi:hypothetical protein [Streptomyces coeruleorubidus]|uniref:hypothetical protein n=1 Tax=Streptomyces coeruleorubidus TaxID=116188 RepID=UPI0033B751F3
MDINDAPVDMIAVSEDTDAANQVDSEDPVLDAALERLRESVRRTGDGLRVNYENVNEAYEAAKRERERLQRENPPAPRGVSSKGGMFGGVPFHR